MAAPAAGGAGATAARKFESVRKYIKRQIEYEQNPVIADTIIPPQLFEDLYLAGQLYEDGTYTDETYRAAIRNVVREAKELNKKGARAFLEAEEQRRKTDAALRAQQRARDRELATLAARKAETRAAMGSSGYASFSIPAQTPTEGTEVYAIAQAVKGPTIIRAVFPPGPALDLAEDGPDSKSMLIEVERAPGNLHRYLRSAFYYPGGSDQPSIFSGWVDGDGDYHAWGGPIQIELLRPSSVITVERLNQLFRDGPTNCVLGPLIALYEKYAAASTSESGTKRFRQRINKLKQLETKYSNGVPEGAPMEEVARAAGRRIIIHDILNNEFQTYYATCVKTIRFTNTRENHIDVGNLCLDETPERVSRERMDELLADHRARGVFYITEGAHDEVRCIRSAEGAWRVLTDDQELWKRHEIANRITEFGLNAKRNPEANEWLRDAVIVNSPPVVLNEDVVPTRHHDLNAAYTQFRTTSRYVGFMGKIHQFRRFPDITPTTVADFAAIEEFIRQHQHAIYKFEVIQNPCVLLQQLNLRVGGRHSLPGPELLMYMELGCRVKLLAAVFGSRCDLNFSDEMIGTKAYQKWSGCLGHDNPTKKMTFPGSERWAGHLMSLLGTERVWFNRDTGLISVLTENPNYYTNHHLFAFLTGYTRMVVMEQMLKLRPDSIRRVVLDGIYHNDDEAVFDARWKVADIPASISKTSAWDGWFPQHTVDDSWMPVIDSDGMLKLRNCVLAGAGGSGKTHSVLTDKGFNNIMYVAYTHQQGQAMSAKYGVSYRTIHKMIGVEGCVPYRNEHSSPAVIIPDEITMYDADWVDKLIEMYPESLILPAGDIVRLPDGRVVGFQCRSGKPGGFSRVWDAASVANWIQFDTDYRSQDEVLKATKRRWRDKMRELYTDGEVDDACAFADWVYDNHTTISFSLAIKEFKNGEDTWIAATHAVNKALLDAGVVSGYQTKDGHKSKEPLAGGEKRGSFTTHGYQGQTISEGRIFISISDSFELAMLYTALSRAVRMEQIVLVH